MTDRDTFAGLDTYRDHAQTRWQRGRTALGWLPYLWSVIVFAALLTYLVGSQL